MKFRLTMVACALAFAGCASRVDRDRLGVEDPTVLKTGLGAAQDTASGAVTPQWLSTYAPIAHGGDTLAVLQQRLDKLPADKNSYFHAKAQCWIDAGEAERHAHDNWGFVEEAVGQAAMITFGLESDTPLSAANPELRTVSTIRPDLWKIVNIIKSDPVTARCPGAQQPLACAEVELMRAGHHAWTRDFKAAEQAVPGIRANLGKSAQADLQCAQPSQPVPAIAKAVPARVTLRADSAFRFGGADIASLLPGGKAQLNEVAAGLQRARGIRQLNINGYTDRLGSDAYNQKLSRQRAMTVRAYLINHGVTLPVKVSGRGKANPLVECTQTRRDELVKCLAPNRRVEVDFMRDGD